jgi:hypothetical protein
MTISCWVILRTRKVLDEICRQNQDIYFMLKTFFQKSCLLWDNVEYYGKDRQARDDIKVWRMHIACWIVKATDTQLEYATLVAFPLQQWLDESASILHYECMYIPFLIVSSCIPFIVLCVFPPFIPIFFIFIFPLYYFNKTKYSCAITARSISPLKTTDQFPRSLV